MKYVEATKDGFRLINRNWQLVLIQVGVMFFSFVAFFIIVGIPLAVAFIIFGVDLTQWADVNDIFNLLRAPSDLLSKYVGLIVLIAASFALYVLVVAVLGIYMFAGSIGVIGRTIKEKTPKFTLRLFTDEAKKLFLRLLAFTTLIGIIFIIAAFFLGLLSGGIAAIISYAQSADSTLALFFGTFFVLMLVIVGLALILGLLSLTLYGIAALFFKGTGALRAIGEAARFLSKYPNGFWLYAVLSVAYLLASFLLLLLSYPFTLIPIIGPILAFPHQLISYVFQAYLGLVMFAIIMSYYYSKEFPAETAQPGVESPVSEPSTEQTDAANAEASNSVPSTPTD
ncbi:MAG: hypothetical protein AB1442_05695 [Nitrospirota bacterium]